MLAPRRAPREGTAVMVRLRGIGSGPTCGDRGILRAGYAVAGAVVVVPSSRFLAGAARDAEKSDG